MVTIYGCTVLYVLISHVDPAVHLEPSSDSNSSSNSDSDSDSQISDSDNDVVKPEYLESLLEKARKNYAAAAAENANTNGETVPEEQVITLDSEELYVYIHIYIRIASTR